MKLIYRQMLSFFAVICTLLIIVTISFINVTNRTLYTTVSYTHLTLPTKA